MDILWRELLMRHRQSALAPVGVFCFSVLVWQFHRRKRINDVLHTLDGLFDCDKAATPCHIRIAHFVQFVEMLCPGRPD